MLSLIHILAAINAKVPIVVHTFHGHVFHSYFNPVKTKAFLEIERYLAKKTDAIVTLSQIQKDELINHFKIDVYKRQIIRFQNTFFQARS